MTTVACPACGVELGVELVPSAVAGVGEVREELRLTREAHDHLRTCGGDDHDEGTRAAS